MQTGVQCKRCDTELMMYISSLAAKENDTQHKRNTTAKQFTMSSEASCYHLMH